MPGGRALHEESQRLAVAHPVGDLPHRGRVRDGLFGVAAPAEQRHDAFAVGRGARHLAAGHHRKLRGREVRVLGLVRVAPVDAGGGHVDDDHLVAGLRVVELAQLEHLGPTELLNLYGSHA
jgi:hypothetical protein